MTTVTWKITNGNCAVARRRSAPIVKLHHLHHASSILLLHFFATGLLAVAVFLFPWSSVPPSVRASSDDAAGVSTATREGRLTVFDDVWQTIHDHYYDPAFRGLDWDAQRTTFRTLAAGATNS